MGTHAGDPGGVDDDDDESLTHSLTHSLIHSLKHFTFDTGWMRLTPFLLIPTNRCSGRPGSVIC